MAEFKTIKISSEVIRLAIHEIVEKRLKSKNNQILVDLASKSGSNNFIGILYRAKFSSINDEVNTMHTLIVKVAPQQSGRRERFQIRPLFLREIFMYKKVSSIEKLKQNFPPLMKNSVHKILDLAILSTI